MQPAARRRYVSGRSGPGGRIEQTGQADGADPAAPFDGMHDPGLGDDDQRAVDGEDRPRDPAGQASVPDQVERENESHRQRAGNEGEFGGHDTEKRPVTQHHAPCWPARPGRRDREACRVDEREHAQPDIAGRADQDAARHRSQAQSQVAQRGDHAVPATSLARAGRPEGDLDQSSACCRPVRCRSSTASKRASSCCSRGPRISTMPCS